MHVRPLALFLSGLTATLSMAAFARADPVVLGRRAVVRDLHARGPSFWTRGRMRAAEPLDLKVKSSVHITTRRLPFLPTGEQVRIPAIAPLSPEARQDEFLPTRREATGEIPFVRQTIEDPTVFPYVAHGRIFMTFPDNLIGSCSGTLVNSLNRSVLITAAHCLLNPERGGFVTSLTFAPGYKDGTTPLGLWSARHVLVTAQWANTLSSGGDPRFDIGAAVLRTDGEGMPAADVIGAQGIVFNLDPSRSFNSFGYPAASPFDGQELVTCASEAGDFLTAWGTPYPVGMGCDMTRGSSGGGWVVDGRSVNSVVSFSVIGRPDVQYGPYFGEAALELYELASAQTVPGVTPDTGTAEPAPIEHPVTLRLRLRGHLIARGRMGAPDGYLPCTRNAPIAIYRQKLGSWREVAATRTDFDGYFEIRIQDRVGRLKVDSRARLVTEVDLCSFATSIVERHQH